MTMKIEDTTIKIKTKKHPNEGRYPGRACRDMMFAIGELCNKLTSEQMNQLGDGILELDPEDTLSVIQTFLPKDQIGLAVQYDNGWIPTVMTVEQVDLENKELIGKDVWTKDDLSVSFSEVSVSKALGYCEILYRDDKPYGQPETQEIKVRIMHDDGEPAEEEKKEEEEKSAAASIPSTEPLSKDIEPTDVL